MTATAIVRVIIIGMVITSALYPLHVLSFEDVRGIEIFWCVLAFVLAQYFRFTVGERRRKRET